MTQYVALGDSISIDDYPQHETGRSGLGAASLFHRNNDRFWPEFAGRDLAQLRPGIKFHNLTADGATTEDVLERIVRWLGTVYDPGANSSSNRTRAARRKCGACG